MQTVLVTVLAAAALLLQGCGTHRACKISDIYGLIQVNGMTGLSKDELDSMGVKLCARHLRKEETYLDDACVEPEKVFADGELPTLANGDTNALLLVRCPSTAYPKGKELQRVTCSDDFMDELEDGTIDKVLHLRFDNYERAANCLLNADSTLPSVSHSTDPPDQILTQSKGNLTSAGNRSSRPLSTVDNNLLGNSPKAVQAEGSEHIALIGSSSSHSQGAELLMAAAAAAAGEPSPDVLPAQRTHVVARQLGPAVLVHLEGGVIPSSTHSTAHSHHDMHEKQDTDLTHAQHGDGHRHRHHHHHKPHAQRGSDPSLFRREPTPSQ